MARAKVQEAVATTTNIKKDDLTRQFKEIIKREGETWFDFAIVAKKIYETEHWKKAGYGSLQEFIARESEGRVSYEIFLHRVKMGQAIEKFGLKREQVVQLGWTKFKELATLGLSDESMETEEFLDLVEEAKEKSFKEVQDFVRRERVKKATGEDQKKVTLKFSLIDEQDNVVKEALGVAMELSETNNPSIGLVYICTEFLMNHSSDSTMIQEIRKKVEEISKEEVKAPHKPHANAGKKRATKEEPKKKGKKKADPSPDEAEDIEALFAEED